MENQQDNKENEAIREVIVERRVGFNYPEMIIIMLIAILFGFLIGNIVSYTRGYSGSTDKNLDEFIATYEDIVNNYYEDVDKEKLLDAGIKGMINYLDDPYASYFEGEKSEAFNESLEGTYQGIGVEVTQQDADKVITKVYKNTPAANAGLQENDIILKIDEEDVTSKSLEETVEIIQNKKKNTAFNMTIQRNGEEQTFSVKTTTLSLPQITSNIYEREDKKVGYIKIEIFSSNIAEQFESALKELESDGIDRLIIDVRDNPGGYLTQTTEILSLFMTKKQVLYQLATKKETEKVYGTKSKVDRNYPVAVLINEESASAAEILASAFKENLNSEIIGVTSYGKGTVQRTEDLENGDTIKYTVQKWLTPDGNWINETGVTPTQEVELNLAAGETLTDENDTQLQKAIEVICEK
ncbi:MAG TPA: S41 family peptidase [Candidatus Onthousia faecigallinarum]|nr:S41 family peptidase [Candidatus Onthousia faecigallinarum]